MTYGLGRDACSITSMCGKFLDLAEIRPYMYDVCLQCIDCTLSRKEHELSFPASILCTNLEKIIVSQKIESYHPKSDASFSYHVIALL